jgi:hypothetical protein
MRHYDESLRYKLNSTNSESGIVLNKNFSSWEDTIRENIVGLEKRSYTREELSLLRNCREHARAFSNVPESENVIAFVHPMYLHLSHMDQLDKRMNGEAEEYFHNLMKILKAQIPKDKAGRVLIETAHHYAAATSLLLEEGCIDAVFFTKYDSGHFDDRGEVKGKLYGRNFFFGGGYNRRCLSAAVEDTCDITGIKEVKAIKEICLDSPQDGDSLKTGLVWTDIGKRVEMISLQDLGRYIGVDIMHGSAEMPLKEPWEGLAATAY